MARLGLALGLVAGIIGASAEAACRQALALGLDVSGSVDSNEYRLQLDGLASALLRADVRDAFLTFPQAPVRLFVYEWAGEDSRRIIVPWTTVINEGILGSIAERLRSTPRTPNEPATAIGEAMLFGGQALQQNGDCWKLTLDLSGDGKSNTGPRPRDVGGASALVDVTINGLVIGSDTAGSEDRRQAQIGDLWAFFRNEVIRGDQAFIEVALGFEDFEDAMARKLLKELQTLAVSQAIVPRAPTNMQ